MKKSKIKFPHGPIRMCVVCNCKQPKGDLVRLGVVNEIICSQPKLSGRGVYICPGHSDVQIHKKRKRIIHLLRCKSDYVISLSSGSGV